jgi:peptide deformylase
MDRNNIIILPNKSLRQVSKRVGVVTDETRDLIKQMTNATVDWEESRDQEVAVGLAAVQVDKLTRVVIIRNDFEDAADKRFIVFVNPEIVKKIGPIEEDYEGCLSVPDIYGKVPRYSSVKIKALNEDGSSFRVTAHGFLARLLQHEVDHIQGRVFIDHIKGKKDAFYKLMPEGGLEPLDYDTKIKDRKDLWE